MTRFIDLSGKRFSGLLVIERAPNRGKRTMWLCVCDCGKECHTGAWCLVSGHAKSCGCLMSRRMIDANKTHGMTNTVEWNIWRNMKQRCTDRNHKNFDRYGGRGIKVCDRWMESIDAFVLDMGRRPSPKHSIDRIDVNGNYEPSNCRWATQKTQSRNKTNNRTVELNGKRILLIEACEIYNKGYNSAIKRLNKGAAAEDIFTEADKFLGKGE